MTGWRHIEIRSNYANEVWYKSLHTTLVSMYSLVIDDPSPPITSVKEYSSNAQLGTLSKLCICKTSWKKRKVNYWKVANNIVKVIIFVWCKVWLFYFFYIKMFFYKIAYMKVYTIRYLCGRIYNSNSIVIDGYQQVLGQALGTSLLFKVNDKFYLDMSRAKIWMWYKSNFFY